MSRTTAFAVLLFNLMLILLNSCGETAPEKHDNIQTTPASAGVSQAQEDIQAQQAAAQSRADAAAAKLRADQAEEKRQQALAAAASDSQARATAESQIVLLNAQIAQDQLDIAKGKADTDALRKEGEQQVRAQTKARFQRFYGLGLVGLLLAAFLFKEGATGKAGTVAVLSGVCLLLPSLGDFVVDHEVLLQDLVIAAFACFALWHYRAKIETALSAIAHLHAGGTIATAEGEVKTWLIKAYAKVKGITEKEAHAVLAALHLGPAAAATPTVGQPPAAAHIASIPVAGKA